MDGHAGGIPVQFYHIAFSGDAERLRANRHSARQQGTAARFGKSGIVHTFMHIMPIQSKHIFLPQLLDMH